MTEKYWVTYETNHSPTHIPKYKLSQRTGFIYDPEAAWETARKLAAFDHIHNVTIEKITTEFQVKP